MKASQQFILFAGYLGMVGLVNVIDPKSMPVANVITRIHDDLALNNHAFVESALGIKASCV